jgi:two-component system chemotaxis sensor kinase CheA
MSELDETVKEFLVESFENLEQLDRELLALESDPSNLETINKIFRIIHTVKGTCGFFDFSKLEKVSHVGENLLDSLRSEEVIVTEEIITALLQLTDILRELLSSIEQTGNEGDGDYSKIISVLTTLNDKPNRGTHQKTSDKSSEVIINLSEVVDELPNNIPEDKSEESEEDLEKLFFALKNELEIQPMQTSLKTKESQETLMKDKDELTTPLEAKENQNKKSELADTSLRVDVTILDKLMNLVGELVLARNQILQFTKKQNDVEFASTSQRLNLITSELQDGVMRTRMQPISTVWDKLPRVVRDMSHTCGKKVLLEMQGKQTELDKTIIEAIKDPLTHIIRNSVDHGIETPERRKAALKNEEGTLVMHAFHEGGQVVIEISDDGAGLNTTRIKEKALEKGLISAEKASQMTEAEVHRLIFLPGFSTAEKITNISGRGVGMDVVRANIERIGGAVDVSSNVGKGTKFTIKIPLTLAIIPGLIVTTNGNRYAIPQVNLLELVRLEGEQLEKSIERIQGSDFYRLRGKILPLVYLNEQFEITGSDSDPQTFFKKSGILSIVVVRADNHQFGLVVDAIHDTEEIVVKPLGRLLKTIPTFAGATIMGDGQVALILDVVGLARKAQIAKQETMSRLQQTTVENISGQEQAKMFVFELAQNKRAAVPLENVYRLEEFYLENLEQAGDHLVVQYRDGILPLVDLRAFYGRIDSDDTNKIHTFVYCCGGQFVGFIVERIVDIVEQIVKVETPYQKTGLIGSGVIQGKVTDLLDLQAILRSQELFTTQLTSLEEAH